MRAVILAGGAGSRLRPLTDTTPKPLIPVNGIPMLERTIRRLECSGIEEAMVFISENKLIKEFLAKKNFKLHLKVVDKITSGMGDVLVECEKYFPDERFLVVCVDVFCEKGLVRDFVENTKKLGADFIVCLSSVSGVESTALVDEDNRILSLGKKIEKWNYHNTGFYIVTPNVFKEKASFSGKGFFQIIQLLIDRGYKVLGYKTNYEVHEADTIEELKVVEKFLKNIGE